MRVLFHFVKSCINYRKSKANSLILPLLSATKIKFNFYKFTVSIQELAEHLLENVITLAIQAPGIMEYWNKAVYAIIPCGVIYIFELKLIEN